MDEKLFAELRGIVAIVVEEFKRELFLQDEINRDRRILGLVEFMENGRTEMEGWIGEDFIFAIGQFEFHEILLDNRDIFALRNVFAEFFGSFVVWFDCDYLFAASGERSGDHARTSANINHSVALFDVAVTNQKTGKFWSAEEMLAELIFTHPAIAPSDAPLHTLRWRKRSRH